jgi:hypothetical protein
MRHTQEEGTLSPFPTLHTTSMHIVQYRWTLYQSLPRFTQIIESHSKTDKYTATTYTHCPTGPPGTFFLQTYQFENQACLCHLFSIRPLHTPFLDPPTVSGYYSSSTPNHITHTFLCITHYLHSLYFYVSK